jgi:hypothetical protein
MALWIKYKQVGLDLKAVLVWAIIWSLTARFFFFTCPKGTPWSKDKCSLKVMELSVLGMNYVRQKCLWFYIAWPDLSIIIFIYMIGIDLHLWDRAFAGRLNDIIFSLIWHPYRHQSTPQQCLFEREKIVIGLCRAEGRLPCKSTITMRRNL